MNNTAAPFAIIPVIDLLDGQVVHARHGDRKHYLPIQSILCASSSPMGIVQALMGLYPFKRLYIADLNAIQNNGHHRHELARIRQQFPQLEIWLDAGFSQLADVQPWQDLALNFVIGSETILDFAHYETLLAALGEASCILSLDFKTDGYHGLQALQQPECWPDKVIAMTLAQVGSQAGPAMDQLRKFSAIRQSQQRIYAAGGVRGAADIQALKQNGIHGVLIATALHQGRLTADDLAALYA